MSSPPVASRVTSWLLRVALGRDRANAILGDASEELARRSAAGKGPRWPRVWAEARAVGYLLAAGRAAAPPALRAFSRIIRDSVRALRSAPGTTWFIVLILTLGIAAATTTFSVVDAVVLRPLPFPKSDELVVLQRQGSPGTAVSGPAYADLRDMRGPFSALAATDGASVETLPPEFGGGEIGVVLASVNLLQVLQVAPVSGQWFSAAHGTPGQDAVAVVSDGLARRVFGGASQAVGQTLRMSSTTLTIIGVMPPGFSYPLDVAKPVEVWRPLPLSTPRYQNPNAGYLHLVARLESTVSVEQARVALEGMAVSRPGEAGAQARPFLPVRLLDTLVGDVRGWMLLVLVAVALVMLVACANVANLLLARSTIRTREMSIRASLGASRRMLVASLLIESLLLSLAAAALGVLIASWGIGVAKAALPAGIVRADGIGLDLRVLGAAVAAAVMTGLGFGAVPAWHASRANLVAVLSDGGSTMAGGRRRWRTAFVVCEVAFVGALLVATTLVVTSFINITRFDLGFDRRHLVVADSVFVSDAGVLRDVVDGLEQIPGVRAVAAMGFGSPPLIDRGFGGGAALVGLRRPGAPDDEQAVTVVPRRVTPNYFETVGLTLVRGAGFDRGQDDVVVLDERAAREIFPNQDPVGAHLRFGSDDVTVAGIVKTVHLDGPELPSDPQVYLPLIQSDGSLPSMPSFNVGNVQFLVRTTGDPADVGPAVAGVIARLAPPTRGGAARVLTVEDAFRNITADRRFNAGLMAIFGVLALVIGIAGIYGVMSSIVAQQKREIGVRVALGATTQRIRRQVVAQSARYLVAGLAIGLPAAWFVTRAFGSLYFGVTPANPFVYLSVAALMMAAGLAATVLPAARAARVDPIEVLRQ